MAVIWVKMMFPGSLGYAWTTEEAFQTVWQAKGWVLAPLDTPEAPYVLGQGPPGPPGPPGPTGPPGPPGSGGGGSGGGVPAGGTTDQILTKLSAVDYATQWADIDGYVHEWFLNSVGGTVTDDGDGTFTITGSAGSSYTAENARDDVGAAMRGETGYLAFLASDAGDTLTYSIDPVFKGRVSALESARALVQTKDSLIGTSGGGLYMDFPTGANYVDTPSNPAFNVAGDCGFITRLQMPAAAPAADWCIFSRRGVDVAHNAFSMFIETTGQMHATTSVNGTSTALSVTTVTTPLAFDGNWIWLRQVRESASGQWSFYTAADTGSNDIVPTVWTTFQLNRGTSAGVLWNNGGTLSVPLEVNGFNAGASFTNAGKIGRFMMFNTISTGVTAPIADANASDYLGGSSWTGSAGRVWTLHGTASIPVSGTGRITNTTTEFTLGETDAFSTIAVNNHDTIMWEHEFVIDNTTGAPVNFTPKLRVAGVDLFTWPAPISVPSTAAGLIYNGACAVRLSVNAADGTTQIARAQMIINNPVTGDLGSISMASNLANMSANRAGAIATITTMPQMQLRMLHGSLGVGSRPLRTQLYLARA